MVKKQLKLVISEEKSKEGYDYDFYYSIYTNMFLIPQVSLFFQTFGLTEQGTLENCCRASYVLINASKLFTERQSRKLFLWVSEPLRPYLVAHGIINKVPSLVFSDLEQKTSFYRFLAKIGVGLVLNNPMKNSYTIEFDSTCKEMLSMLNVRY